MNSLLAARRRLELLGQYMLDERGVLQEEAAAKEREGLAHLIQRQQRLLVSQGGGVGWQGGARKPGGGLGVPLPAAAPGEGPVVWGQGAGQGRSTAPRAAAVTCAERQTERRSAIIAPCAVGCSCSPRSLDTRCLSLVWMQTYHALRLCCRS
jgi:hypothetical protein